MKKTAKKVKEEEFKQCPFCSEDVKKNAKKCEHCGDEFDDELQEVKLEEEPITNDKKVEEEFKQCPFCAENIKIEAIFCKHCKSSLNEEKEKEKKSSAKKEKSEKVTKSYLWYLVIIGLLGGYWISVGTPNPLLFVNYVEGKETCLRIANREKEKLFLKDRGTIFVNDWWFKKGKLVIEMYQSDGGSYSQDILCLIDGKSKVKFPRLLEKTNWR